MYVTFNYNIALRRTTRFIHTKPTHYFLTWYPRQYTTIVTLSNQKLPRIARRSLVKLL